MPRIISRLSLLVFLFAAAFCHAEPFDVLAINAETSQYNAGRYLSFLEDRSGSLSVQDLHSPHFSNRFQQLDADRPSFGFTRSVYWAKLKIWNSTGDSQHLVLDNRFANTHYVDFYIQRAQSAGYAVAKAGNLRALSDSVFEHRRPIFELDLDPGEITTIYIRTRTDSRMMFDYKVWNMDEFSISNSHANYWLGLVYGLMTAFLVYNLMVAIVIKEKAPALLALSIVFLGLYQGIYQGLVHLYLKQPWVGHSAQLLEVFGVLFLLSIFFHTHANLKDLAFFGKRVQQAVALASALLLLLCFEMDNQDLRLILTVVTPALAVYCYLQYLLNWKTNDKILLFQIFGYTGFFACLLLHSFVLVELLPNNSFTEQIPRIGMITLFSVMTAANAMQMNQLKLQAIASRNSAIDNQRTLRDMFDNAHQFACMLTPEGKLTRVNHTTLEFVGLSNEDLAGQLIWETPWFSRFEELKLRTKDAVISASQGEMVKFGTFEVKNKGESFWIEMILKPVLNSQHQVTMLIVEGWDLTEIKNAELNLQVANKQIRELKEKLEQEVLYLQEEIRTDHNFEEIIGNSPSLTALLSQVEMVAKTDASVLIRGESGTGKELIARAIHESSERKKQPLIKINCAAIAQNLVESELFGHEKGAFTGAIKQKSGRFELADGGTVFLDEVAELPMDTQVKLLRFLQEQEFERVGGTETHKVDVRVIAATNQNFEQLIEDNRFRADLFYRLNVFPLAVPPLRERQEDISLLTLHFIEKFSRKMARTAPGMSQKTHEQLLAYNWPGNIRELENIIERAMIVSRGDQLKLDGLDIGASNLTTNTAANTEAINMQQGKTLMTLDAFESEYICKVLGLTNGVISGKKGAAKILGLNPNTLRSRMKKLNIN